MTTQPLVMGDGSASTMTSIMGFVSSAKEKWDSSGANEHIGRVTASIPESTKKYVGSIFKREHIRSISVFFGIGEERPFYVEKNASLLVERLRHNMTFFYLNYCILTMCLFCLTIILSPTTIVGMAILGLVWMWFIRASSSGSVVVGTILIPQKTGAVVLGGLSAFFLLWIFQNVFWWTMLSSGFLVAIHAFLRDASMHKDMDDVVAMEGDLHMGEDSAFLNAV